MNEPRSLLQQAQARCQELLALRRGQLDAMAQVLPQSARLYGNGLKALLAAEPMMSSDAAALA